MHYFTVTLALTISVSLVVFAPADTAPTTGNGQGQGQSQGMMAGLPALDLSCSGVCNAQCQMADGGCRLIPGLGDTCDSNMAACAASCQMSCACTDQCTARCSADAEECNHDDNLVDAILCGNTEYQCRSVCPLSCGFKASSALVNSLMQYIQSQVTGQSGDQPSS